MKNKLYYLLAVLYIMMFGFILYINGVFTEASISMSNLIINMGFLLIIGVLFLISFSSFGQLNQLTDALVFATEEMQEKYDSCQKNLWQEYRQQKDLFPSPVLNAQ